MLMFCCDERKKKGSIAIDLFFFRRRSLLFTVTCPFLYQLSVCILRYSSRER